MICTDWFKGRELNRTLKVALLFGAAAIASAAVARPAVAWADFQSYSGVFCQGYAYPNYENGYAYGGTSGNDLLCPLVNNTDVLLSDSTSPTLTLKGYNHSGNIWAEACYGDDDDSGQYCDTWSHLTTKGTFSNTLADATWASVGTQQSFFLFIETGDTSDAFISYTVAN